jgi:cytochrome d ubiquinol oxidase subunit I
MDDLMTVVDWSRWQFALTAIYHWLFVPLTLGLSVIVAVMETIALRRNDPRWLAATKFWMLLFGINFAIGVATGMILEFEFGTNWSNYSWFVGDIFGAPLAIEGLLAFFMEATFVAVMFFGWGKVSPKFHLAATWLTTLGASISALWILVANAWMQNPVGMEFDPEQMRNVMTNFFALFSGVAINKFFHAVLSGWTLAGVFVIGVSCWFLLKKRNTDFAIRSIKVGGWIGLAGLLLTMWTGDGSAVEVSRCQPMKLAAMEGLYNGSKGAPLVGVAVLNPEKRWDNNEDEYLFNISIPKGLSLLAKHNSDAFVPGISDIVNGVEINDNGDTISTVSYEDRILLGKAAHQALRDYDKARMEGNSQKMQTAEKNLRKNYNYFGYGYFDNVDEAIPPIAMTFYAFHIMVILGGYFILFFAVALFAAYRKQWLQKSKIIQWIAILSIPLVYVCSQAGWIVAEVGRQPWTVQDLLPTRAAISAISSSSVMTTFWMFAVLFTLLLVAEISIMFSQISKASKKNLETDNTPQS